MKRALVYSALAIILGLTIVLAPLIALAQIKKQDSYRLPETLSKQFREVEGSPSDASKSTSEVESLGACFAIALVAYVFFRGKRPEREYRIIGKIPY